MSKKNLSEKPSTEFLIETRDELILMLFELGHGPTEIGFIVNRSKQLISHVIKKHSKNKKTHVKKS